MVLWRLVGDILITAGPYAGFIVDGEFIRRLENGYQMEKHEFMSQDIGQLMTDCWKPEPHQRPTFIQSTDIVTSLTINSIDEYLVEINRLEKKSSPTVTMSEIASLGILVAQGEDQPLPTVRPSSSKEPVDVGESDLTLPALAKMIGRLTNKVNQLAGPEEKEKPDRHQKSHRPTGRQVHYDHPPQYSVHYPPPMYPGYHLPQGAVLTAAGQPGMPDRPTMNMVPTATSTDPSATFVRGPDLRICYHCRKKGHIAPHCPDKDKPPVPREAAGNGRAGLDGRTN